MAWPGGWRERARNRWRRRWQRRNDPHHVRAMFWMGLRHGHVMARVMALMLGVGVVAVVVWQGVQ